jgi:hypothetical protein
MTDNDVKIIGRSNTALPKEETDDEIRARYKSYNHIRSWRSSNCYYQFYSSRGTTEFVGYKHNPTGVIFMLHAKRDGIPGGKQLYLNRLMSATIEWHKPSECSGFQAMTTEMDAIDSKRKNWDIVKLNVKSQFVDDFDQFYICDGSSYTAKGDFSAIMEVTEVLQKGCKTIGQMKQVKNMQPIQASDKIQEMII